jgi:poly(hydroxyalkanoate) granule-associated protein
MSEEVEVHVRQIDEEREKDETMPAVDAMRRLLLASIGAMALSYDEAEKFINRLIERGELAQKDGEKVMNEVMNRFRQRPQEAQVEAEHKANELGTQIEQNVEQFFNRLNIPTKRDIDELSARVAQLAARVEEMSQSSSTSSGKSSSSKSSS